MSGESVAELTAERNRLRRLVAELRAEVALLRRDLTEARAGSAER